MSSMDFPLYSFNILNYIDNSLEASDVLFDNYEKCCLECNKIIKDYVLKTYNTIMHDEHLFPYNKNNTQCLNSVLQINDNTDIIVSKYDDGTIDLYIKNRNKGYIFNDETLVKQFKFSILEYQNLKESGEYKNTLSCFKKHNSNSDKTIEANVSSGFLKELQDRINAMNLHKKMK